MKIGLDIMGGDHAPSEIIKGAVLAIKELPKEVTLTLIGDEPIIKEELKSHNLSPDQYEIIHSQEVINMGESPIKAFTQKPNSSIAIGFKLLAGKKIAAFASAGNTGAMLVGSMYSVKTIPGVIRPCLTSMVPKENGKMGILLDVGANSDCKPDVLYQFGLVGSLYVEHVFGIKNPKVGLMNIGEEQGKGNLVSQAAYEIMKSNKQYNFVGNVEGFDLFNEKADVIVCDGFTGNVIIKQAEGIYELLKKRKLTDPFIDNFNYENHGGSPILGVNGAVVVGHGVSNSIAVKNMVKLSINLVESNLSEKIGNAFSYSQVG
jgi:phosphate acyltransferase